jgi:hypothetical protein
MMRRPIACELASALALALALGCGSCSAPARCDAQQTASEAPLVESEKRTASLLLSGANESQTLHFRARLSDLPELWSGDQIVQGGALPFELNLRYESEPFAGDGHTEMPRLMVTFTGPAFNGSAAPATSKYPGPEPSRYSPSLFDDCAFGSRQCETALAVQIKRLEGAPFPPVRVDWHANASAQIVVCSELATGTRLSLEVETP